MTSLFRNMEWRPSTVSWLSFVLMGLIVAGIGLLGTAHVVNYLQKRLMAHSVEHNQEIVSALIPKLEPTFLNNPKDIAVTLSRITEGYEKFGFRIFVLDRNNQMVVMDSGTLTTAVMPFKQSWLDNAARLDGSKISLMQDSGAVRTLDDNQHPTLIWLQEIGMSEPGRWVLGVAKNKDILTEFMGDLHWHLDFVLLLTYVLITLLGYYAMRSIGRTYERRLESQVRERTNALEAVHKEILLKTRLATIGQTATVLTHEMRNPLASIKLALSGLRGVPTLESRELKRVGLVLGEVDRLDGLLSETLDYVRPINRSSKPVDIGSLFATVLNQQGPSMEEKGVSLVYDCCEDCIANQVDEGQIHQVLLNLIKNAIEASPQGGQVVASLQCSEDELVIEITNDGETLSEDVLQRAFEPFFTTRPKGTGLGLGLVKRVVEEHGGVVEMVSNATIGTQLTLTLPLNPS